MYIKRAWKITRLNCRGRSGMRRDHTTSDVALSLRHLQHETHIMRVRTPLTPSKITTVLYDAIVFYFPEAVRSVDTVIDCSILDSIEARCLLSRSLSLKQTKS